MIITEMYSKIQSYAVGYVRFCQIRSHLVNCRTQNKSYTPLSKARTGESQCHVRKVRPDVRRCVVYTDLLRTEEDRQQCMDQYEIYLDMTTYLLQNVYGTQQMMMMIIIILLLLLLSAFL